jgi:hypothetical protein
VRGLATSEGTLILKISPTEPCIVKRTNSNMYLPNNDPKVVKMMKKLMLVQPPGAQCHQPIEYDNSGHPKQIVLFKNESVL